MKAKKTLALTFCALLSVGALSTSCGSMKNVDMAMLGSALQKSTQAMTLSNAQVQEYVKQAVAQMDAEAKIAPASSPYTKRLNNLTKGFKSINGTPLNFKVYVTDDINAFACADGSVRVYTGIMDMMTDDELLGIIGHEIGHVANEDSKDAFKQALMNSALSDALGSTSSTMATLTQGQLGQLANSLMSAKYSRKQESEADDYGYDFLKANGRNPYNMVLAFEKMQALEGQAAAHSSLANAFSDHPDTAKRIENMKKRCQKDGYTRPATKSSKKSATKKR